MESQFSNMTTDAVANTTAMPLTFNFRELQFVTRAMFYLVGPNETTYRTLDQVPNYFLMSMPYLPFFFMPEILGLLVKGQGLPKFGDFMCSLCCLLLIFLPVALFGQLELALYIWIYEKFHIVNLAWNSPITWFLCLLGTDLGLYLWHRAAHEINIIWAFHQVHHTSQEFNLSVGARLPSLNRYVALLFYLPCALFFPPSVFYVHYQLNYMFQFWIHSAATPRLGVLENFVNTPSLHRVHHGRNRYCIDKNYAAVFIFWDMIFGTFEREKDNEEIYYGLVHPINSFDPVYIQIHHLKHMYRKIKEYSTFGDRLSVVVKGPGWEPGKPRLGYYEDIPVEPEDKKLYNKQYSFLNKCYVFLQFSVTFVLFNKMKLTKELLSLSMMWLHGAYIFFSVCCIGAFLEQRSHAAFLEAIRCALFFVMDMLLEVVLSSNPGFRLALRVIFGSSLLYWILQLTTGSKSEEKIKTN